MYVSSEDAAVPQITPDAGDAGYADGATVAYDADVPDAMTEGQDTSAPLTDAGVALDAHDASVDVVDTGTTDTSAPPVDASAPDAADSADADGSTPPVDAGGASTRCILPDAAALPCPSTTGVNGAWSWHTSGFTQIGVCYVNSADASGWSNVPCPVDAVCGRLLGDGTYPGKCAP